jgi:hypothetical protein
VGFPTVRPVDRSRSSGPFYRDNSAALPRYEIGDVFRLTIDSQRVGFGQIVGKYGRDAYYFAIFEQPHHVGERVNLASVVSSDVALLALSFDALLFHGDWEVVGRHEPPALRWGVYKKAVAPGVFEAVDHTGEHRRRISAAEAGSLPTRMIVAPALVQNALRALHGAAPWHEAYDRLRY